MGAWVFAQMMWHEEESFPVRRLMLCSCWLIREKRGGNGSSTIKMTSCDGTPTLETWCCGLNNTECCNSDKAITIAANFGSSTSTPSTSPSGSPSADNSSTGLSDGAKAGLGVGAAVGGIAMIAAFLFWFMRHIDRLSYTQRARLCLRTAAICSSMSLEPEAQFCMANNIARALIYFSLWLILAHVTGKPLLGWQYFLKQQPSYVAGHHHRFPTAIHRLVLLPWMLWMIRKCW